jgi:hypothetical protein
MWPVPFSIKLRYPEDNPSAINELRAHCTALYRSKFLWAKIGMRDSGYARIDKSTTTLIMINFGPFNSAIKGARMTVLSISS